MHANAEPVATPTRVVTAAVLCCSLWLFAQLSATGRVLVHWLSGPLLPGASATAAPLFIAGLTCALLRIAVPGPGVLGNGARRFWTLALLAALVVGHGIVVTDHLRWADEAGISPTHHGCRGAGSDLVCDDLLHSRFGATMLASVWSDITLGVVPPLGGLAMLAAVSMAVLAALALLPDVVRRFSHAGPLVWLYVFPVVHAVVALVDGGPLSVRLPVCFTVLLIVIGAGGRDHLVQRVRRGWPWPVAAVVFTVFVHSRWSDAGGAVALDGCAMLAVVCAAPLALGWRPVRAARRRMRSIAAVLTLGCAGAVYVLETANGAGALLQPLAAGYRFTVLDLDRVAVVRTEPVPIGWSAVDVYRTQGEDPLEPRRVFLWRDNGEPRGTLSVSVVLPAGRTIHAPDRVPANAPARILGAIPDADVRREVLWIRGEDGAVPPYFPEPGSFLAGNNAAVHLHLVAALLRYSGLSGFALAPIASPDDAGDREAAARRIEIVAR
jgi:hypothetical protein